ncbi:ribonuclease Y [Candidatus Peregrinibacteria bacterium]|nr:ribonuclease Y [Candidatus Peregrinibacteria bacterium]
MFYFFIGLIAFALGAGAGFIVRKQQTEQKNQDMHEKGQLLVQQANTKSQEVLFKAKNEALKIIEDTKHEEEKKRDLLRKQEERLVSKEEALDKKIQDMDNARNDLESKMASARQLREEVQKLHDMQVEELNKISGMSRDEAKAMLLKQVEEMAREDMAMTIKKADKELQEKAKERAKFILADAIQKYAAETATESTATMVNLPSDDMKGRIIGKEGRNINSFEQATGIDVIVDDTPGSIVISGFDLVRRYIAKIALEKLISDGRIHPARIEETVEQTKEEINVMIKELGEKAAFETGVTGLHPNLIKLLGRLKFRTSFGQNVLKHSMEVAMLSANIASDLGADVTVCRKAGLLHDVGKAVDHEIQGHHAIIGRDIAKKFGLPDNVVHAIEAHEGDIQPNSVEAMIVSAANAIANARPGATKDNLDTFIKRQEELENVAKSFEGVQKVFAVQAGNEVRVFVTPQDVDDYAAVKLSHDIARKIERDLQYPGIVKVSVIRETRAEHFAM